MKFKQTHKPGGVVVELGAKESPFPVLPSENTTASPVFRLKKILVPVDFSDCSKKALVYATGFARQFSAELTLLHVVEPYPPVPQMDWVDVESVQEAQGKLDAIRSTFGEAVAVKVILRTGEPHLEIVEAAKELGIDLIILSTHGRSGLMHVILGSTVAKVARHANCPVLIVREGEHDFIAGAEADEPARPQA